MITNRSEAMVVANSFHITGILDGRKECLSNISRIIEGLNEGVEIRSQIEGDDEYVDSVIGYMVATLTSMGVAIAEQSIRDLDNNPEVEKVCKAFARWWDEQEGAGPLADGEAEAVMAKIIHGNTLHTLNDLLGEE